MGQDKVTAGDYNPRNNGYMCADPAKDIPEMKAAVEF
jgi:hypothetical protein